MGAEETVEAVRARLEAAVPGRLDALEAANGWEAALGWHPNTDPPVKLRPRLYAGEDRPELSLDEFPAVLVVGQEAPTLIAEPPEDGELVWRATYRLRIFTFVRGQEFAQTSAYRYRLIRAVREVLAASPRLTETIAVAAQGSPWRESYSETSGVDPDDGRSVAGAYLELPVRAEERLAVTALGTASSTVVTGEATGPGAEHPAL